MTVEVLDRYGRDKIGMPDNSQFVMPKAQMDDLVARTGGDVGKLEQALGIPEGAWTNREMVQINIATPRDFNVRMPSGNEMGANNLWLPGGRLPTGQLEAVVDQIPKGGYTESLLPQAGKNVTPSNAPALNLAPAGHGMKPVTNPPAPATPVKAHTSANQANQGSHPIADPGASPTVKRAINALQEGSPDTRIGKTELQFREAVEGGAKGVANWGTGPLRAPARAILENEGVLIDASHGLQSRTSGLFNDVQLGQHGEAATKYLYTVDQRGVNVVMEQTPFPTPRGNVVHTNISSEASIGGEAWFGPNNSVTINAGSGRFGDAAGITRPQWDATVKLWESLGYKVNPVPFGKR